MFLLRWETDPDILWKAIQHGYISSIYEKIMGKVLGLNSPGSYEYGLRERQHRHNLENMNWAKIFNITVIAKKKKEAKVICAMCMLSHFSHAQLQATTWTLACQAPLSMEISKQEYWIGLPCPLPGESSQPTDWTSVSCIYLLCCKWILYIWATGEAQRSYICSQTELCLKLNVTKEPRWWTGTCYKFWTALSELKGISLVA